MKQEILSEEERILYVALTRAKEKLYITGRIKDFTKYIKEKNKIIEMYNSKNNTKLDYKIVKKAKSYLDWMIYVYLLNQNKQITLKGKKLKINNIVSLNINNKKELLKTMQKEEKVEPIDIKEQINKLLKYKTEEEKKKIQNSLEELLEWKYSYLVDTKLPTKTSVTKIKEEKIRLEELTKTTDNEIIEDNLKDKYKPKFMKENENLSNVQKGTLVHLCIQRLDEKREYSLNDIKNIINNLLEKEIITQNEAEAININLIYQYTKSKLFKDLQQAKEIHKEQQFYINIPAKDIIIEAKLAKSNKNILVQGIIDLYYIDKNDKLILIDFKTDYVPNKANAKEKILEKYKTQLEIYKIALEQALGKKVDKAALCLANCNYEQIELK